MRYLSILPIALLLLALLTGTGRASSNSTTLNLTLQIIGLPPGSTYQLGVQNTITAGIYNTQTYPITAWTTTERVTTNTAVLNTYAGCVPYSFVETTVTYNSVVYTLNESNKLFISQVLCSNRVNVIPFYAYLDTTPLNTTQVSELQSAGLSPTSPIIIGSLSNIANAIIYGSMTANAGTLSKYATYDNERGNINFVATNVVKNPSPAAFSKQIPQFKNIALMP